jgi:hypothetical protein
MALVAAAKRVVHGVRRKTTKEETRTAAAANTQDFPLDGPLHPPPARALILV